MWAGTTSEGVRRLEEFRCPGGGGRGVGAVEQKSCEHQVGKSYAKDGVINLTISATGSQ